MATGYVSVLIPTAQAGWLTSRFPVPGGIEWQSRKLGRLLIPRRAGYYLLTPTPADPMAMNRPFRRALRRGIPR